MKKSILLILLFSQLTLQAFQSSDSLNVIVVFDLNKVLSTGNECKSCTVIYNGSDKLIRNKYIFENGEEKGRTDYEYYSDYPGKLFSISTYAKKILVELKDQINLSDSSNYSDKLYFESGALATAGFIKSGLRDGLWNHFYESGKLKQSIKYTQGQKNGKYKEFGPNGKIIIEGNYRNDSTVGKWAEYDSIGELVEEYEYKNGERISKPIKLNRAERIKKSMNQFLVNDADLKGTVCFYNIEKKDTLKIILAGERISILRKSGMPEITDGFLRAVKDSNIYVSNRNAIGLEVDFVKIPLSDILKIGFLRTFQASPGTVLYSGPNYRLISFDDPNFVVSYFPFGKHITNFNDAE